MARSCHQSTSSSGHLSVVIWTHCKIVDVSVVVFGFPLPSKLASVTNAKVVSSRGPWAGESKNLFIDSLSFAVSVWSQDSMRKTTWHYDRYTLIQNDRNSFGPIELLWIDHWDQRLVTRL